MQKILSLLTLWYQLPEEHRRYLKRHGWKLILALAALLAVVATARYFGVPLFVPRANGADTSAIRKALAEAETDPALQFKPGHPSRIAAERRLEALRRQLRQEAGRQAAPAQKAPERAVEAQAAKVEAKSCPCSGQCTCGCNAGQPCVCQPGRDGTHSRPATAPAARAGNYGVLTEEISASPRLTRGGEQIGRDEALRALTRVPDDAHLLRLTVISRRAEDRQRVLADLERLPQDVRARVLVQAYPPDHWAVTTVGLVGTGAPTIYLQRADGKVLHRQDTYAGPEDLIGVIRRADPNYSPANDPNLLDPLSALRSRVGQVPALAWVLVAGAAAIFVLQRSRNA